jgi:hypothetical protein
MDKVITNLTSSQKRIKTADYMLTMTYETVKEPKLLITILNTVFLATKEAIDASLYYERHFKRIPAFNENNFEVKLDIFKRVLSTKYGIKKEEFKFIDFLRQIKKDHKDSAVEFSRKENFFIFDDNYKGENIDKEVVKNSIINAKLFIDKIYHIISNKQ